jgi:hypothetical protein
MSRVAPVPSMTTRAGAAVLGGVLAVGALAGCGGSDDGKGSDSETPTVDASATEESSAAATEDYLPVPEGVTLTEPGTDLGFGDTATIAWRPRQDTVVALDLTVERIDVTTFKESFEGWVITPQMRGQVPYFVRAKATNVSGTAVGQLLVPVYAQSGTSSLYEPLDFREEPFEPCPGGQLPEKLRPGKSADLCFVYLLPEGQELTAAAFDLVGELEPITWSGEITPIEKPDKKGDKKGDKGRKGDKTG